MTLRRTCTVILPALALLAGCGQSKDSTATDPVALVKLAKVDTSDIDEKVTIYGATESGAVGSFTLSSPVEAIVRSVDTPVGNAVRKGQIIVRLTPSPASSLDLANANASASAADLAYARAKRLRSDGLVSDAEVENARAAKQSAVATSVSLQSRFSSLILRAPGRGTVEMLGASAGELVAAGTAIVTIVKDGDLRARFGIDPALARRVPPGSSVDVRASGDRSFITVPVLAVDNVVDPQTKLASIYVRIPDVSEIGSGESLTGQISLGRIGNGISIPYVALLDDGGQPFVFIIAKGVARRRDITTGPQMGDRISVTSGLKPGELVATEGVTALEDGMKVRTK